MEPLNREHARSTAHHRHAPQKVPEPRPAGWGRLGLAALLGLVAGTVLFPTPARGREDTRPGP